MSVCCPTTTKMGVDTIPHASLSVLDEHGIPVAVVEKLKNDIQYTMLVPKDGRKYHVVVRSGSKIVTVKELDDGKGDVSVDVDMSLREFVSLEKDITRYLGSY